MKPSGVNSVILISPKEIFKGSMTFEHSELQRLVEGLTELFQRYAHDPAALEVLCSEFNSLYERIPIYTGIIANLLGQVVKPASLKQLNRGDEVSVLTKRGQVISGKVVEITEDGLKLSGCKRFHPPEQLPELELLAEEVKELRVFTRDILDKVKP